MKAYRVGGAVRDQLLGIPVQDIDWVVVGSSPDNMLAAGYTQVGADFPVFLHPETKEEYALARTERKTGAGYHGFDSRFGPEVTLEDDLGRRDLTINAMAMDETGRVIDPYDGQKDLENRVLRHVTPAFSEDPLRVLRVARFLARFAHLGFRVAPETLALMRELSHSGELETLVAERVWKEISRLLKERSPAEGILCLREVDALRVILPEVDALFGIPQDPEHYCESDAGRHTLKVLDQAARLSRDLGVRFAALVHDLGKTMMPPAQGSQHEGQEHLAVTPLEALCDRLKVPRQTRKLALQVAQFHHQAHRALELDPELLMRILERTDALRNPSAFADFLTACEAAYLSCRDAAPADYPQKRLLQAVLKAAQSVSARPLAESGLKGEALGAALREERLRIIAAAVAGWKAGELA